LVVHGGGPPVTSRDRLARTKKSTDWADEGHLCFLREGAAVEEIWRVANESAKGFFVMESTASTQASNAVADVGFGREDHSQFWFAGLDGGQVLPGERRKLRMGGKSGNSQADDGEGGERDVRNFGRFELR